MRKFIFGGFPTRSYQTSMLSYRDSENIAISHVASLDMIIIIQGITKALIRLRRSARWSAPLLFANPEDRFLRQGSNVW